MSRSPYDPRTRKTRNFVFFLIVAIALPSLALTGFGFLAVEGERLAAMKHIKIAYTGALREMAAGFNQRISELEKESIAPLNALAAYANDESVTPDNSFTTFFANAPFAANYFVFSKENQPLLANKAATRPKDADLAQLTEQLRALQKASTQPVETLEGLAGKLASSLNDPTLSVASDEIVERIALEAITALDLRKFEPRLAVARDRFLAASSRSLVMAAVAALRSDVGESPTLRILRVNGYRRVLLVKGQPQLIGFELVPAGFNTLLSAYLDTTGANGDICARILNTEIDESKGQIAKLAISEILLKKTDLTWFISLHFSNEAAMKFFSSGRSRYYFWAVVLIAGILVASIFYTVQTVLKENRISRLKTDFVSNVSHELRTPLTSIRMFTETLLLGRVNSKEEEREFLETIGIEAERLSRLTERVLDFSRMEANRHPYHMRSDSIPEIITLSIAACRPFFTEVGARIAVEVADDLPLALVDRDAIVEVMINLLSNACKYTTTEPQLTIRAKCCENSIQVEVVDNGIGIPKAEQKKIFEKFYRVETPLTATVSGSGLGLSLVRYIVEAHGGNVAVHSTLRKGSTFIFRLPLVEK